MMLALGALIAWIGARDRTTASIPAVPSRNHADRSHAERNLPPASAASLQKVAYRYSVIPGGARSRQELTDAIARDEVVAAHYRSISIGAIHAERVKQDSLVYVSYRRDNKIFWTKHQVRLSRGETILTDGVTQIRGRCGNCISVQPMTPTADDEPANAEFDALTAIQNQAPPTGIIGIGPGSIALNDVLPSGFGLVPSGLGLMPFGGGIGGPMGGSIPFGAFGGPATQSDSSSPTDTASFPATFSPITLPSGGGSNGGGGTQPDLPSQPPTTSTLPPLIVLDTPPITPEDPLHPPETPPQPDPVPEPGTLLLIGGGLATMLARHRRSWGR
jgi:hypothetical protein